MAFEKENIKFDPNNYRIRDTKAKTIINKSLKELGAGRSIVLDNKDIIIAGNGVFAEAEALGIPVKVVETTGDTIIAVKRTDIGPDDEKRKLLALADNKTSDLSEFDMELVME